MKNSAITTNKGQDNSLINSKLSENNNKIVIPKGIIHLYFEGTNTGAIISSESLRLLLDSYAKDNAVISSNLSTSPLHTLS